MECTYPNQSVSIGNNQVKKSERKKERIQFDIQFWWCDFGLHLLSVYCRVDQLVDSFVLLPSLMAFFYALLVFTTLSSEDQTLFFAVVVFSSFIFSFAKLILKLTQKSHLFSQNESLKRFQAEYYWVVMLYNIWNERINVTKLYSKANDHLLCFKLKHFPWITGFLYNLMHAKWWLFAVIKFRRKKKLMMIRLSDARSVYGRRLLTREQKHFKCCTVLLLFTQ